MADLQSHIGRMSGATLPRWPAVAALLCLAPGMLSASAAYAGDVAALYSAVVVVTGRENAAERERGIREALPLVLTKLTVDGALAQRALEQGLSEEAASLVESLNYFDRKEGVQISDEQGTRERSFELTVTFDRQKIDAMVASLGGTAWTSKRPRIGVALLIDDGASTYLLTRDSERGYGQRWAMDDEARALALTLDLPANAAGETAEEAIAAALPNVAVRLEGRMTVTTEGYWDTHWQLTGRGVEERFASSGATFDRAIEKALRQSAQALARTLN